MCRDNRSIEQCFEVLNLSTAATAEEVKTKFRELCMQIHPDKGGSAEQFMDLRTAYWRALAEVKAPKPCDGCGATGTVASGRGFYTIQMPCQKCHGRKYL